MTPDQIRAKVNWKLKVFATGMRTDHVAVIWLLPYTPKSLPNGEYTGMIMEPSLKRNVIVFSTDPADVDFYTDYTTIWINPAVEVRDDVKHRQGRKPYDKRKLVDMVSEFEAVIARNDLTSDTARAAVLDISETKFINWRIQYNLLFPEKVLDKELH